VLDRLAPLAHLLRMFVEPALHRLKNVLMFPSGDAPRDGVMFQAIFALADRGNTKRWSYNLPAVSAGCRHLGFRSAAPA